MSTEQDMGRMVPSLALLRTLPMFTGVPDAQLETIVRMAVCRKVARHTTIVRAGDHMDSIYVIIEGNAKVLNSDADGREVILSWLGPGEFFGEMGMIDGSPRSANVVASEACELLVMAKAEFKQCLADNFDLCLNIMKSLVHRLREADRKIESLALMDVYGRVAKLLLEFSSKENGQRTIVRKLTKLDISKMVGASREMVSRVMKDLEASGYIQIEAGRIILNLD